MGGAARGWGPGDGSGDGVVVQALGCWVGRKATPFRGTSNTLKEEGKGGAGGVLSKLRKLSDHCQHLIMLTKSPAAFYCS